MFKPFPKCSSVMFPNVDFQGYLNSAFVEKGQQMSNVFHSVLMLKKRVIPENLMRHSPLLSVSFAAFWPCVNFAHFVRVMLDY